MATERTFRAASAEAAVHRHFRPDGSPAAAKAAEAICDDKQTTHRKKSK
jgi:hypothetical protein